MHSQTPRLRGGSSVPRDELLSPFDNQWIVGICKWPAVEFEASFILWRLQGAHTLEAMKVYRKVLRITIIIQASVSYNILKPCCQYDF